MKAVIALALVAALVAPAYGRSLLQAPAAAPAAMVTDADVLNFALNLECLEAEFYSWAAYGQGLTAADLGNGPASVGGMKANLTSATQAYAAEIAQDEIAHVRFLRRALGPAAVPCPAMDIGPAFAAAANAALNMTLSPAFSPYANDVVFLHGAYIFEDVGVTAYKGAAGLLTDKNFLSAAAGILAVEAYHAGEVRTLLAQLADFVVPAYGVKVSDIIAAISNLRDAVDGATDLDQGIVAPVMAANASMGVAAQSVGNTTVNVVPADADSIAFGRNPAQVLAIVYLGSATKPGGFFPNGLNGLVK